MPIAHLAPAVHVDPDTKSKALRATLPRQLKQPKNDPKHPAHFRFHVKAGEQAVTVLEPHHEAPVQDIEGNDISTVKPGTTAVFTPAAVSTPHKSAGGEGPPMKHKETGKVLARPGETVVTAWQRLDDVLPN